MSREQIVEYLEEKGIIASKLADLVGGLFVQALLERNVLLKDLHFGNLGLLEDAQVPTIGIVDFGGINESFPESDKNWILSLIGSLATQNQTQFKTILLASVALNRGSEFDMLNHIPILNAIERRVQAGFSGSDPSVSPFEAVQEVLGEVYESWPLSEPVKDFIESLRKVVKEWGPWISEEMLADLGANLVIHSFSAHAELSQLDAYKKAYDLLTPPGHEQLIINSDSDLAQESFDELDKVPKSSSIIIKDQQSNSWTVLYLSRDYRFGEAQVFVSESIDSRTANTKWCRELARLDGYLEYRDYDDAIQRIHLKRAFG